MSRVTPRRLESPAPLPLRVEAVTLPAAPADAPLRWEGARPVQAGTAETDGLEEGERMQRRLEREMRRYCSWRDVQLR